MAVTGFDSGHGKVAEMDEALAQADRLLRLLADCPDGRMCSNCRSNIRFMRARIRKVRGFRALDTEEGD